MWLDFTRLPLSHNRMPFAPWLTVEYAEREMAIQQAADDLFELTLGVVPELPDAPDIDFGRALPVAQVARLWRMRCA